MDPLVCFSPETLFVYWSITILKVYIAEKNIKNQSTFLLLDIFPFSLWYSLVVNGVFVVRQKKKKIFPSELLL